MFKTIAQFILLVALSVGLVSGVSPDVRNRLAHAWDKIEAVATHVVDLATQAAKDLAENAPGQTTIGASANAGASASTETQSSGGIDLGTSLEGQTDVQAQADINSNVNANAQTSGSTQSETGGWSFWNFLFGSKADGGFNFSLNDK
ncbi:MAG: hypothetical protein AB1345_07000 [Chloroflexota bacterium]